MRVAICVVFVSIFASVGVVSAAVIPDQAASYPISVSDRDVIVTQDAIEPSATQQEGKQAHDISSAGVDDRRLASLDPTHIVFEQSQAPLAQQGLLDLSHGRLFPRQELRQPPRQHGRSSQDFLLMGFVALMLVAYQLRKKHRFLRPHPFTY